MTRNKAIENALKKSKNKKRNKNQCKHKIKWYSWNDTHLNCDEILKSRKIGSGNFATVFQYVDIDGKRHWKTGWYSNRSNFIYDFQTNFNGNNE